MQQALARLIFSDGEGFGSQYTCGIWHDGIRLRHLGHSLTAHTRLADHMEVHLENARKVKFEDGARTGKRQPRINRMVLLGRSFSSARQWAIQPPHACSGGGILLHRPAESMETTTLPKRKNAMVGNIDLLSDYAESDDTAKGVGINVPNTAYGKYETEPTFDLSKPEGNLGREISQIKQEIRPDTPN